MTTNLTSGVAIMLFNDAGEVYLKTSPTSGLRPLLKTAKLGCGTLLDLAEGLLADHVDPDQTSDLVYVQDVELQLASTNLMITLYTGYSAVPPKGMTAYPSTQSSGVLASCITLAQETLAAEMLAATIEDK